MEETMKALQFSVNVPKFIAAKTLGIFLGNKVFYQGPFKTVSITDIPEPVLPSQEWAKIRTIYCGFCGSDLNLILLHDSPTASPFTSFPCVMGHEIVGEIMEQQGIKTESLVTHFFKLDEYCQMIKANINKKASRAMKTVVSFDQKT